jgi:hypothetical protein
MKTVTRAALATALSYAGATGRARCARAAACDQRRQNAIYMFMLLHVAPPRYAHEASDRHRPCYAKTITTDRHIAAAVAYARAYGDSAWRYALLP